MESTTAALFHRPEPFADLGPQPVDCRWLSERDEKAARSAEIIRLIVDDKRGHCGPWANHYYQSHFLREVQDFIGPTNAVLVTDAGAIKSYIGPLDATVDSLRSVLKDVEKALSQVEVGPRA